MTELLNQQRDINVGIKQLLDILGNKGADGLNCNLLYLVRPAVMSVTKATTFSYTLNSIKFPCHATPSDFVRTMAVVTNLCDDAPFNFGWTKTEASGAPTLTRSNAQSTSTRKKNVPKAIISNQECNHYEARLYYGISSKRVLLPHFFGGYALHNALHHLGYDADETIGNMLLYGIISRRNSRGLEIFFRQGNYSVVYPDAIVVQWAAVAVRYVI
uniref:DEP domain-containing protein n=1 Tax=Heterorhabditis bacteriophora TaxID=37862 RepID=A0A1I7X7I4_HETBA